MSFNGGCHCGAVTFSVDAEVPTKALSCNCSICKQKGLLLSFFPAEQVTFSSGENSLTTYQFNAHKIAHRFCQVCGCQAFATGKSPDGSEVIAVNLRSVPAAKLEALELQHYDGASK